MEPEVSSPQQQFTLQDLATVLKGVIQELKAPSAEEVEKKRKADLQMLDRQERSIINAAREEENRERGQASCPHRKRTGQTNFAGQPNADGYVRFICVGCTKEMPPVKAPQEWISGGVNAQDPNNPVMWSLTEAQILEWARHTAKYFPPPSRTPKRLDISKFSPDVRKAIEGIREKRVGLEARP